MKKTKRKLGNAVWSSNNEYTLVYQPVALSYSLSLFGSSGDIFYVKEIKSNTTAYLKSISNVRQSRNGNIWIDLLYKIHKPFPKILYNFLEWIDHKKVKTKVDLITFKWHNWWWWKDNKSNLSFLVLRVNCFLWNKRAYCFFCVNIPLIVKSISWNFVFIWCKKRLYKILSLSGKYLSLNLTAI